MKPKKYSNPEMSKLAHDYHVLKSQEDLKEKVKLALGGKCMTCGSTNLRHLKLVNSPTKNWNKVLKDVKAFPHLFALTCANCDIESVHIAKVNKLEEMAATLFWDAMKNKANGKPPSKEVVELEKEHIVHTRKIIEDAFERAAEVRKRKEAEWLAKDQQYAITTPTP